MTAILVQFPNESVEVDDVEKHRVLTALEVIYEGGSLHGKTADFPTRDLERLVVGVHERDWHFFETYERTICVDIRYVLWCIEKFGGAKQIVDELKIEQ